MNRFWHRLCTNKAAVIALAVIMLTIACALAAPWLAPYDPLDINAGVARDAPSAEHWLGTDGSGRDVLSRLLYGARIALHVATASVAFALLVGGAMGLCAGYFGGWIDEALSRVTDMMFAMPDIILALVIMTVLGNGQWNLVLAIGIVYTPIFARVARGSTLAVKQYPYVEAAHALGAGDMRVMRRHILPNIMTPLIVQATLSFALAILAEGALSFLGIGLELDTPSWGVMLREGKALALQNIWWLAVFPGLAITALVLSFNVFGDGLRDALDPRTDAR